MAPIRHDPVLLEETLDRLSPASGARVIDATVGLGGHSEALLERTNPDGQLLGLDRDAEALTVARERLARFGDRVTLVHASFGEVGRIVDERGFGPTAALLLDLGMSSFQLDDPDRGFRFRDAEAAHTPLDMRMDPTLPESAADLLARADEDELAEIFHRYGELPGSRRLARMLVEGRDEQALRSAADLQRAVEASGVGRGRKHHPATLVFQALRIAVNDELGQLESVLDALPSLLAPGGRVAVISYHSLEDRIVKRRFQELVRGCVCPPKAPICTCGRQPVLGRITRRVVSPAAEEIRRNPRARSARLRVAERLPDAAGAGTR